LASSRGVLLPVAGAPRVVDRWSAVGYRHYLVNVLEHPRQARIETITDTIG
jgi:hypothetical protein